MVSNPAFFRGPETWLWVPCFWGGFKVGGPIFGAPRAIFGVPSCVPFRGPLGFEVLGHQGGLVVSNPAFLGGQRCNFGFLAFGVILG